ncbi:fasciclin domain-containing protein [Seonamhaeicola sp. NFXS20]|uniref:fasciclin domain-containing protein n=1 Tax=Seonamhaeicola sp. NFXS20 TaxID=2816959 RepID=UPI003B8AD9D8
MLFIIIAAFGCKPDPLEYARPDNLVGTIYPQLEALGTFNYYLQALDQTSYKEPLTKGGSWTIFAPTDEAFEEFMQAEGYGSFDAIPAERIEDIVKYSIIIDAWNTTTLTYYSSGFYEGNAFKRRTQYQDPVKVIDAADYPHLMEEPEPGTYPIDTSNGRIKPVCYFLDSYFDVKASTETSDYDYMFPGEQFNEGDMKVFEANVEQANIIAENGMIYALDKVIEPRKNLYQNLSSEEYEGKYSMFKKILERFAKINEVGEEENPETGEIETIYRLSFATGVAENLLPYNPDDENFPKLLSNVDRTLANATGLLVPTNDALQSYLDGNSILGQFYNSYDDMPLDVLGKFIKPFFFTNFWDICPSNFGQSYDVSLNLVDYKEEDVVDKKFCSNGFFVGINTVYTNNSFGSTMGPLLLDPDYTIMLKAVQELGIDQALQSQGINFSIFGIKNHEFQNIADPNSATRKISIVDFEPDLSVIYMQVEGDPVEANNRIYPDPNTSSPSSSDITYVMTTLKDIVLNQIVEEKVDFNSNNYYETKSGEFIYASGGKIAGGGDILNGNQVDVVSVRETDNGQFYEMSGPIERPLRFTYGAMTDYPSSFANFIAVLEGADALLDIAGSDDKLINFLNLQKSFTLLVPNNEAIDQAVADGVIPNPDPSYLSSLDDLGLAIAKKELLDFAKKHFIQQAIPADGRVTGTFPSMYYSRVVDFVPVYDEFVVENDKATSSLTLTNTETNESVSTSGISNLLSKKVVIHEIDNYIK